MRWCKVVLIPLLLVAIAACTRGIVLFDLATAVPDLSVRVGPDVIPPESGSFDFGVVEPFVPSIQSFVVENSGTATLTVSGVSFLDAGSVVCFTMDTLRLEPVLAPGETTTFAVTFKPNGAGPASAVVLIASDDINRSRYSFTVTGSGSSAPSPYPRMALVLGAAELPYTPPAQVDFGVMQPLVESSTVSITVENRGGAPLTVVDIVVEADAGTGSGEFLKETPRLPFDVAAGGAEPFSVLFSPGSPGAKGATLIVASDDPSNGLFYVLLRGGGASAPEPDIAVRQGEREVADGGLGYDFGSVYAGGSTAPRVDFSVENTLNGDLVIAGVTLSSNPGDFSLDLPPFPAAVRSGTPYVFSVIFSPLSPAGYAAATVSIVSNDPDSDESSYTFTVEGDKSSNPVGDILVRDETRELLGGMTCDFGPVTLGSEETMLFSVGNSGSRELALGAVTVTSSDGYGSFELASPAPLPSSIPPGGTASFQVRFTPFSLNKTAEGTLTIPSGDPDPDENPFIVKLAGWGSHGPVPDINVRVGSVNVPHNGTYDFGGAGVDGTPAAVRFTVENLGQAALVITGKPVITKGVEHLELDASGMAERLARGEKTTFTVRFAPALVKDNLRGRVEIGSNDPDEGNKYVIDLIGDGL